MSRVSVIIPNYNHSAYLKQRIDSVLTQDYQDFEVLILDDCSTDNSREIIENYRGHPKVHGIIYSHSNSGNTFLQWEKGIKLAKGEWVWVAESDDWCEHSLLTELMKGAKSNSECTLSYCQTVLFKDNSILYVSVAKDLENLMDGATFVHNYMLRSNSVFNASMCIFKRSAYFKVSNEFTNYKYIGDWVFWIEIAIQGKVFISGKTLNYFRNHANDVTSGALKTGLLYSEYFRLLKHLQLNHNLIGNEMHSLLRQMQKKFLIDYNVEPIIKYRIHQKFKKHLGNKYYIELASHYKWRLERKLSNWYNALYQS